MWIQQIIAVIMSSNANRNYLNGNKHFFWGYLIQVLLWCYYYNCISPCHNHSSIANVRDLMLAEWLLSDKKERAKLNNSPLHHLPHSWMCTIILFVYKLVLDDVRVMKKDAFDSEWQNGIGRNS